MVTVRVAPLAVVMVQVEPFSVAMRPASGCAWCAFALGGAAAGGGGAADVEGLGEQAATRLPAATAAANAVTVRVRLHRARRTIGVLVVFGVLSVDSVRSIIIALLSGCCPPFGTRFAPSGLVTDSSAEVVLIHHCGNGFCENS
jgi:hypothetical protein